jgi:hypothetical protein
MPHLVRHLSSGQQCVFYRTDSGSGGPENYYTVCAKSKPTLRCADKTPNPAIDFDPAQETGSS